MNFHRFTIITFQFNHNGISSKGNWQHINMKQISDRSERNYHIKITFIMATLAAKTAKVRSVFKIRKSLQSRSNLILIRPFGMDWYRCVPFFSERSHKFKLRTQAWTHQSRLGGEKKQTNMADEECEASRLFTFLILLLQCLLPALYSIYWVRWRL